VSDTGVGIDPEFLPHVFERFQQADNSLTRRHGGMGLGLAIVRQITELHGGTVRADSRGLNLGATFTVELPLSHVRDDVKKTGAPVDEPGRPLDRVRILVVDDDRDARELLRVVFLQAGADVTVANSATEAEEVAMRAPPDVLVCDIGMPGEDGYQLLRRLRENGLDRGSLPAVAITAYTGAEHRRRALEAGYAEHVPKPVDVHAIIDLVARLVHDSGSRASG
jgi:CheY-like chemotaxis protein